MPKVIDACFAFHVPADEIYESATGVPFQVPIVIVPSDVKDDAVTPDARVPPVSVPAAAVTVMFADPLKLVPLIVRGVVNVAALPVVF